MLLEKLHIILGQFLGRYNNPLGMRADEIRERLEYYVALNKELLSLENEYEFNSQEEEIQYFKYEKPNFQQYGIYYERINEIELLKPFGDKKYYIRLLKSMKFDYKHLADIVVYFRSKQTDKDGVLFNRLSKENHIFAVIKALEMIEKYLLHADSDKSVDDIVSSYSNLKWTGKYSEFVEIINGLKLTNVINGGDIPLQEIAMHFAKFLNIELNDVHGTTHDVMMRMEPARFTKSMVNKIEKKQDELKEKEIQRKYKK